jgi:hypothetical protein
MRRLVALSLVVALAGGILAPVARVEPAHAAEVFTVNHPGDEGDFGDGFCDAYPAEGPQCTLRAALFRANATAARDTIRFALPGPVDQVKSIKPETPLPTIVQPVTIDGYTQPGSSRNTLAAGSNAQLRVQLDGTNAAAPFSFANGLRIDARGVLVRGLVINRFSDSGIWIEGAAAAGVRVVGNFLGTDAGGGRDLGNFHGVRVNNGAAATIGGTTPAVRNLISGNNDGGVTLTDGGANTVI